LLRSSNTKITLFIVTMPLVWSLDALRIPEYRAGLLEGDLVLLQVRRGYGGMPLKAGHFFIVHEISSVFIAMPGHSGTPENTGYTADSLPRS
jgi:hypothetical protein